MLGVPRFLHRLQGLYRRCAARPFYRRDSTVSEPLANALNQRLPRIRTGVPGLIHPKNCLAEEIGSRMHPREAG